MLDVSSFTREDLVATNAMVSGYVQLGFVKEAMCLAQEIQKLGLKPNIIAWNTLISGFSQVGDDSMVSEIFQLMRFRGIEPNVVSWTSNEEAFDTFRQMLEPGLLPSSATISSLLPACASIIDSRHGKEIHGYSVMIGVEDDIYVRSALVDMYAKCGFIYEAKTLFDTMLERNSVTWNSMIFGIKLDHLTFTALFTACSRAGLVKLTENLFCVMQEKYQIEPRIKHYACLVDLLGRARKITEAYDLIKTMPIEPDLFVWGALLGSCRQHGNIELAEIVAKHLRELEPDSKGNGLLLSSLYADAGSWEEAAKVKKMMKKRKLRKFPGCSWSTRR
ncbi:hypothetical protein NMG60_11036669 [Bertholletia excelsa]